MHFRYSLAGPLCTVAATLLVCGAAAVAQPAPATDSPAAVQADEDSGYVEYQLRANEDPSRVAKMFHVTIEDILRLNNISDPRRLGVGTTLKIPDPRAVVVQQLRSERAGLQQQLASAQSGTAALQARISDLSSQVSDLKEANESLQTDQTLYHTMRVAVLGIAALAVALAVSLLMAWGKARHVERQHALAMHQVAVLQAAVEKYRQLSAQFELKYQNLFHHVGMPSPAHARAQALRAAYDEDRARLDAIVAEAEQDIRRAMAKLSPDHELARGEARLTAVAAARKA